MANGDADEAISFVEISPENYMHRGGRAPARLERVAARKPVITHGLLMSLGGGDRFDREYFTTLKQFLDRHDPPWHSDHLCFSTVDQAVLHDLLPVPFTRRSARRVAARVREARDRLERPMAVENISWYMKLGSGDYDEAEFIADVLDAADCGLLLDVNNCLVNALNHGFDVWEWISRIPLERVWQLHVAGHEPWDDSLWIDTHGATARPEVHELMAWVIERVGPKPVVLERDNNIPPLSELLDEVARFDSSYRAALSRWQAESVP